MPETAARNCKRDDAKTWRKKRLSEFVTPASGASDGLRRPSTDPEMRGKVEVAGVASAKDRPGQL